MAGQLRDLPRGEVAEDRGGAFAQLVPQRLHFLVDVERRAAAGLPQFLDLGFQVGDGLFEIEVSSGSSGGVYRQPGRRTERGNGAVPGRSSSRSHRKARARRGDHSACDAVQGRRRLHLHRADARQAAQQAGQARRPPAGRGHRPACSRPMPARGGGFQQHRRAGPGRGVFSTCSSCCCAGRVTRRSRRMRRDMRLCLLAADLRRSPSSGWRAASSRR